MKKGTFIIGILFLILFLSGQEIQEEAIAINIEVPVRVFTKGKFVEELNLEDFEVYEDGVLQKVEALYLIKRTVIERDETETDIRQERKIFIPETSRTFILVFEMMDYFPRIKNALHYFFDSVISPGDSLICLAILNVVPMFVFSRQQAGVMIGVHCMVLSVYFIYKERASVYNNPSECVSRHGDYIA